MQYNTKTSVRAIWVTHQKCSPSAIQSQGFFPAPQALVWHSGLLRITCVLHVLGDQWFTCLLKRQLCRTQRSLLLAVCSWQADWLIRYLIRSLTFAQRSPVWWKQLHVNVNGISGIYWRLGTVNNLWSLLDIQALKWLTLVKHQQASDWCLKQAICSVATVLWEEMESNSH